MAKTAYEQLMDLLDADTKTKVQAKLAENPKLIAEDAFTTQLFGIYKGVETGNETVVEPVVAAPIVAPVVAAVHVPTVPNTVTAPVVAAATQPSGDSAAILAALTGLKSTMETNFKNVVTKDQLPELGRQLRAQSIQDAHLTMKIENLHRQTFGEEVDLVKVGKFIDDQKAAGITYPDVEKAYLAMPEVTTKMQDAIVAKRVDEQVKQKMSGAMVPGQTTSSALSPAQQVIAKQKAAQNAEGKTGVQAAIEKLAALERSREMSTVQ